MLKLISDQLTKNGYLSSNHTNLKGSGDHGALNEYVRVKSINIRAMIVIIQLINVEQLITMFSLHFLKGNRLHALTSVNQNNMR